MGMTIVVQCSMSRDSHMAGPEMSVACNFRWEVENVLVVMIVRKVSSATNGNTFTIVSIPRMITWDQQISSGASLNV